MNSTVHASDQPSSSLTGEELTITFLYYITAFLIMVTCLIFINKRI